MLEAIFTRRQVNSTTVHPVIISGSMGYALRQKDIGSNAWNATIVTGLG